MSANQRSFEWRCASKVAQIEAVKCHTWLLVQNNPSLKALAFENKSDNSFHLPSQQSCYQTLSSLPELIELEILQVWVKITQLLDTIPTLQRLTTAGSFDFRAWTVQRRTWANIRAFKYNLCLNNNEFFWLLRCFPNIEEFEGEWDYDVNQDLELGLGSGGSSAFKLISINNISDPTVDIKDPATWINIDTMLQEQPLKLERLHLTVAHHAVRLLPLLIVHLPLLTEISLSTLNEPIATVLATYCLSLQVVRHLNPHSPKSTPEISAPKPEPNIPNILLTHCRHLRVFEGTNHTIDINTLLDEKPWACSSRLEVLRCQFFGFRQLLPLQQSLLESALNYPHLVKQDLTNLFRDYERCKVLHQLFFSTLARLCNLRILDLGPPYEDLSYESPNQDNYYNPSAHYVHVVPDSPSLTLLYGLDQLATLTKLEVLNFEAVDHRMKEVDITWIATHFKSLRHVHGLHPAYDGYGYREIYNYIGLGYGPNCDIIRVSLREAFLRCRTDVTHLDRK
ncbi:MAG: hypothetical protein J3R72DRAFT_445134 [Linnemannia gamsii]|nr:MAG: hypothetical protein J3R72DRAFT_445134 [Linnemannia gamsii]